MDTESSPYQSLSSAQKTIILYLCEKTEDGKIFFKSKHIASELEYNSREIGLNLGKLSEMEFESLTIERWNSGAKEATWEISVNPQQLRTHIAHRPTSAD